MKAIVIIATLNAAGLPALRVAGALFLIVNLLAGAWLWRHRRKLFAPDATAPGDRPATRYLQVMALGIPWAFITFRLLYCWVATWIA